MRMKIGILLGLLILAFIALEVSFVHAESDNANPTESSPISNTESYPILPNMAQFTNTTTHHYYVVNMDLPMHFSMSATATSTTTISPLPDPDNPPENELIFHYMTWVAATAILAAITKSLRHSKVPQPVQRPIDL